ncbi:4-hydroxyphenylacetate 3-monooxygenase, oxygenase component [Pullulanibacillus sp. KACC 23026]|uniref:4-hydroxyphenylacetate 3-monooxygenase, oxygenase component n=1 Tax=Pullulanibacillus sp. KACC 23026 TaxID=3028315 RepID=UPI0023AF6880|nr:4-hydroxyphenylacetate 3-monooxygenase, oxygenase component [Pullulanibacillus sp. KACC 23026]WEG10863.1 4-hydroxyphenylacetate 3-monooxygenase, oxygenase component [Pullulanibacillus sp. KACC 23026]
MAIATGQDYIKRIDELGAEIWFEGQKITEKLSTHKAFKGLIHSQAALYDLQHHPDYQKLLTYETESKDLAATAYLPPKTKEDLEKKRLAVQTIAKQSFGMLGRSPEYMNTVLMTLGTSADCLKGQNEQCAENMRNYYRYIRDHDLSLTHTFILPQTNRSSFHIEDPDSIIAARIIDQNEKGIVIHGARLLATQGPTTDEILVFPSGAQLPHNSFFEPMAFAFALPSNTPGLKYVCRESFDYGKSAFDHPLGSRFEEMDTIVIFDHVTVPWDRVFLHGNIEVNNRLYKESDFAAHTIHLILSKNIIKIEFLLGLMESMIRTIKIGEYQHVHEKITECLIALETFKGLVLSSEHSASLNKWGVMTPDIKPLEAGSIYYPKLYPRLIEIIKLLGASGLMSLPTEADFKSPEIGDALRHYLQTPDSNGEEKVRLFRLAWDASLSAFGGRQELYERFFFGDPVRKAGTFYKSYPLDDYVKDIERFLHSSEQKN